MFLTGCVSSLSAQQSFWKEDFSAGKLPDGWMIVDSTKSAKCEWIVTDQPYPGSFQFEQQAPPIASTSRGYHMQFRPGVVTGGGDHEVESTGGIPERLFPDQRYRLRGKERCGIEIPAPVSLE